MFKKCKYICKFYLQSVLFVKNLGECISGKQQQPNRTVVDNTWTCATYLFQRGGWHWNSGEPGWDLNRWRVWQDACMWQDWLAACVFVRLCVCLRCLKALGLCLVKWIVEILFNSHVCQMFPSLQKSTTKTNKQKKNPKCFEWIQRWRTFPS